MNKSIFSFRTFSLLTAFALFPCCFTAQNTNGHYQPTPENLRTREAFRAEKFGIFIHWGIYSTFAQSEWFLQNAHLNREEYAKAAGGFYPAGFNADEWVKAFKEAGARYVTFTSRHHDGFSMFRTAQSPYNICDATPFHRDIIGEMSQACHKQNIPFHIYYSLLDWTRDDYPLGRTGHDTGRTGKSDYNSYFLFMKAQLKELLTQYGTIGAIWFDGGWDNPKLNWRLPELYAWIHNIQPACIIGSNHHLAPYEGEDFQMFEKDLPGENKSGLNNGVPISKLPLEMCETMNDSWGYKATDQNYKSSAQLIQLLVRAAAKGSNLLLDIGPQPDGQLPQKALERLKDIGKWTSRYGESLYDTSPTQIPEQTWGVTTQNGKQLFIHIFNSDSINSIQIPLNQKVKAIESLPTGKALTYSWKKKSELCILLPADRDKTLADYVVRVTLR